MPLEGSSEIKNTVLTYSLAARKEWSGGRWGPRGGNLIFDYGVSIGLVPLDLS